MEPFEQWKTPPELVGGASAPRKIYRRAKLEARGHILHAVNQNGREGTLMTHVMYESNLSWTVMMNELQFLASKGLVEIIQNPKRAAYEGWGAKTIRTNPGRKICKLTEKGIACLRAYSEFRSAVAADEREEKW